MAEEAKVVEASDEIKFSEEELKELGDLQTIIDEALEQHRISRFFTIRPKSVEFKRATLLK